MRMLTGARDPGIGKKKIIKTFLILVFALF